MRAGEFSANAGGGFMYGDAALPHNDWCDSLPVGHKELISRNLINIVFNPTPKAAVFFAKKV